MNLTCALRMPSLDGLILLRRRVFRVFVVYLLNQVVNSTHVSFLFLIEFKKLFERRVYTSIDNFNILIYF